MALLPVLVILGVSIADTRGDEPRDRRGEAAFRGKIVFFGAQLKGDTDASRIMAIDPDGTGLETIFTTSEKGRSIYTGRIAPDARSVAFTILDYRTSKGEVWLLGLEGERRKVLDDGIVMAWSPDGAKLACIGGRYGEWKSFVLDLATGGSRPLPIPEMDHVDDWSPDGKYQSVMLGRPDKTFKHPELGNYPLRQIGLIKAGGDERKALTSDPALDNLWSRFSPDGNRTAHYQREHRDGHVFESSVIRDRDGGTVSVAISYDRLDEGLRTRPADRPYWNPEGPACWSPDGKTVAWLMSNEKSLSTAISKGEGLRYALVFTSSKGGVERSIDLKALGLAYPGVVDWGK